MRTSLSYRGRRVVVAGVAVVGIAVAMLTTAGASVQAPVGLGTATAFAVLGGQTVTNTGASVVNGDLGVSPGTAITGFPPGTVNGTVHAADAVAAQAQADLTIAYNDAAGRAPDANLSGQDLGGLTLNAGVYKFDAASQLTGTVALDAQGDPNAVFIFQIGSTLTTASNSFVTLLNGAQACHAFWQIGSSATLGTNTTFIGTVLALTSITAVTGTTVNGRLLARNGAVSLDTNVVTNSACAAAPTTTVPAATPTTTAGATTTTAAGATTTTAAAATTTIPAAATTTIPAGATTTAPAAATTTIPAQEHRHRHLNSELQFRETKSTKDAFLRRSIQTLFLAIL